MKIITHMISKSNTFIYEGSEESHENPTKGTMLLTCAIVTNHLVLFLLDTKPKDETVFDDSINFIKNIVFKPARKVEFERNMIISEITNLMLEHKKEEAILRKNNKQLDDAYINLAVVKKLVSSQTVDNQD